MERRLAAIMFADIVDHSRLMGEDEAAAVEAIRELKSSSFEPTVARHGGEILKRMGDGWVVAFSSASACVECGMECQRALADHPKIKLRIGAHIGEIIFEETDFHGAGVNLAQRLEAEAPPGGIMISQDLQRQLTGTLAQAFSDAGSFKLKNIALPVIGFQWRPIKAGTAALGSVPVILVEDFAHAPDDSDTRAAVADLRDQLIMRLSRRTGVRVLDAQSAPTEKADYSLKGRLRIAGQRGRLQLSLTVREEGRPAWSQNYEADTGDIFAFVDGLIDQADASLRLQINAFDGERVSRLPVDELSVSELRARAASHFYEASVEGHMQAVELLDRALRMKADDPMSLAMRAEGLSVLHQVRYEEMDAATREGLSADLDLAVERLPRSDYIFFARGEFRAFVQRDAEGALKDAERAMALTPNYVPGLELMGSALMLAGRARDAIEPLRRCVGLSEQNPLQGYSQYLCAVACLSAGEIAEAREMAERVAEMHPKQRAMHLLVALCRERDGDQAGAERARQRADALPREPSLLAPRPPLPPGEAELVEALKPL